MVYWTCYIALQVSPGICERKNIRKSWGYSRVLPHHTKIPFIYSADLDVLYAEDLTEALLNPNTEAPFAKIVETQFDDLRQLATLFKYL